MNKFHKKAQSKKYTYNVIQSNVIIFLSADIQYTVLHKIVNFYDNFDFAIYIYIYIYKYI